MIVRMAVAATVIVAALQTGGPVWSAEIAWRKEVTAAGRESAASGKPLLVMVKARWCGPCHQMLRQSFPDPAVTARINAHFVPLLIDADEQSALIQKLNINAFPTVLILDANQRVAERVTGFQSAAQLNARLAAVQPAAPRIAQRPMPAAQPPRPASPPAPGFAATAGPTLAPRRSFYDRAWAQVRSHGVQEPGRIVAENATPGPRPGLDLSAPRDTLSAAMEFSAGR